MDARKRRARWILPALLGLAVAGCGGDWRVEFGGHTDGHGHDHDHEPPGQPPAADAGLFLLAGDVCQCAGSLDGTGPTARFNDPEGIVADGSGNIYVAERGSSTIRKITAQAVVTTLAGAAGSSGSADGVGGGARFNGPTRLEADRSGNLYVTDTGNSTIRKVSPEGVVTTLAGSAGTCGSSDGIGAGARFCAPQGIVLDWHGNLFVADTGNHTIRKIAPSGAVTTVAGVAGACGSSDGRGGAARFCEPRDIDVDQAGNLYVADTANSTIRMVSPSGEVSTIAGRAGVCDAADGLGDAARFCQPGGIKLSDWGMLYVADTGNATIRSISPSGRVGTVAGVARRPGLVLGPLPGGLDGPQGIGITGSGTLGVTSRNLVLKLVVP